MPAQPCYMIAFGGTPGARLVKSAKAARAKLTPLVESLNASMETAAAFSA